VTEAWLLGAADAPVVDGDKRAGPCDDTAGPAVEREAPAPTQAELSARNATKMPKILERRQVGGRKLLREVGRMTPLLGRWRISLTRPHAFGDPSVYANVPDGPAGARRDLSLGPTNSQPQARGERAELGEVLSELAG
jgi:hypothetical protein